MIRMLATLAKKNRKERAKSVYSLLLRWYCIHYMVSPEIKENIDHYYCPKGNEEKWNSYC